MPTQLPTDAQAFLHFLAEQVGNGGADKSPEQLLQIWRAEHAGAIEDVRQGIRNMEAGLGRSFEEVNAEIRQKYNISEDA